MPARLAYRQSYIEQPVTQRYVTQRNAMQAYRNATQADDAQFREVHKATQRNVPLAALRKNRTRFYFLAERCAVRRKALAVCCDTDCVRNDFSICVALPCGSLGYVALQTFYVTSFVNGIRSSATAEKQRVSYLATWSGQ